jgi:hypothetical protein
MPAVRPATILRARRCGLALLLICAVALLVWVASPGHAAAAERAAAERQLLAERGLFFSGSFAVTRQELDLRKRLDTIDAAIKRVTLAHQQAQGALERNEIIRANLRQAEAAGKSDGNQSGVSTTAKSPGTTDSKGRPTDRLNSQMPDVTGAGDQTPLQLAMIDWINARSALEVTVLEIERTIAVLDREYRTLAADPAVTAALKSVGNTRLGPAKDYRRNNRISAAREVFTANQPVYRESGRWRISAVLNERTPATFSYVEQSRPTFIATLAQSLGIEPEPAAAEKQRIGERELAVRRAKLPSLRLGKLVFRDVPVFILPPEAEDQGSQLASGALAGCRVRLEPNRMSLELQMQSLLDRPARTATWVAQSRP